MGQLELVVLAVVAIVATTVGILVGRSLRAGARHRTLLERLPETAITVFDPELRFRYATGPAHRYAGRPPEDLKGRTLSELYPATEADALAIHYRAAFRGETRSFEYRSIRSGRDYWVRIVPFTVTDGEVTEGLAVSIDVTDHERAVRELGYRAADVDAVVTATRALARSTDASAARIAVCEGARQVADAPIAALFEPAEGRSGLKATAAVGANLRDFSLTLASEKSGAARAFIRAEEVFVAAGAGGGVPDFEFLERTGAVAVLWHPVVRDRAAVGVLAIGWREPLAGISLRLSGLIDLLGAEAAVAIGRAELLGRLELLTLTDDLTGLPNRRSWEQELPRELARTWREDRPVCVAMLDIDHFKEFNDHRGHQAGDRLLRGAADAWRSTLRPYDTVARYGGEEFSVILSGCALEEALALVERLRAVTPEGQSCSAGIAEWDGNEEASALVGRADAALYRAKRAGRDQAVTAPTI